MDDIIKLQRQFRNESFRNLNHENTFHAIGNEFERISHSGGKEVKDLIELFRTLRDSCISCEANQILAMKTKCSEYTVKFLLQNDLNSDHDTDFMKLCGLQFLGNFVTGNRKTMNFLWKIAFPDLFSHFFKDETDEKVIVVCSMILYNCLFAENALVDLMEDQIGQEIAVSLCKRLGKLENQDWGLFCVTEHFIKHKQFLPIMHSQCQYLVQCDIYDMLCDIIESETMDKNADWFKVVVIFISGRFNKEVADLNSECKSQDASILPHLLKTLCAATSVPGSWRKVIDDDLVQHAVILLGEICRRDRDKRDKKKHEKSRKSQNKIGKNFTSVSSNEMNEKSSVHGEDKMQEESTANAEVAMLNSSQSIRGKESSVTAEQMPIMCLRRDLVHLIGNLCYKSKKTQDLIRNIGGISLILDSCMIDEENPFMQQWSVFTIRNLCEENSENQAEIAELEALGAVESPVLRDMGLTVHQDEDGKLKIRPI